MTKKILIIGIDSMDSELVYKFIDDLPNIRRLMENSPNIKFEGVFPPDSPTSWASIYSGLNPAKHGVLLFIDPLEKTGKLLNDELNNSTIKGRTFWDFAGRFGKKVYIFYPLLGYPVWNVNGIMIGRATTKRDVQMHPLIEKNEDLSELDGLRGLPGRNPKEFIERGKNLIKKEVEFALKYINKEWDLFFFYSSVLDPIQHNFWNCFDNSDPTYKKGNDYENIIQEFYKKYDEVIGEIISHVDSETTIMLLSDHGHMRRPINIVNINKILYNHGYLSLNLSSKSIKTGVYKKRSTIMDFITKYKLSSFAIRILKTFPNVKLLFTSPDIIDWDNTIAYVSDLSGIKAYTYGGIVIRKDKLKDRSYEDVINNIINLLINLKHPITEKSLIKWVKKREELYEGEFLGRYTDIIYELIDDYGAGWSFEESLITSCDSHSIQPGSHRQYTPLMIIYNSKDKKLYKQNMSLVDVAPTILDLLGIDWKRFDFDGKSVFCNPRNKE